ncbi:MAG: hypothetical protein ACFFCS_09410 [Candidatus Hodarchaeota archaeon]
MRFGESRRPKGDLLPFEKSKENYSLKRPRRWILKVCWNLPHRRIIRGSYTLPRRVPVITHSLTWQDGLRMSKIV